MWLIPTAELQRRRLEGRDLPRGPHELYLLLAATIEREAREQGVPIVTVDEATSVEETVAAVEKHFAEALAAGPRAETATERRALLRDANAAVAAQVRAYYARPWAEGEADSVIRAFLCECGDPACDASVELAVRAFSTEPVLAPGHG